MRAAAVVRRAASDPCLSGVASAANHDQRDGNCQLDAQAQGVDQRGIGQDRPAAAEQPQQHADHCPECWGRGNRHNGFPAKRPPGLSRVGGLQGIDGSLQLGCGLIGDLPQSGLIGKLSHHLGVHRVDDHRVTTSGGVGAHGNIARQQQADLAVGVHRAVRSMSRVAWNLGDDPW